MLYIGCYIQSAKYRVLYTEYIQGVTYRVSYTGCYIQGVINRVSYTGCLLHHDNFKRTYRFSLIFDIYQNILFNLEAFPRFNTNISRACTFFQILCTLDKYHNSKLTVVVLNCHD